MAYQTDPTTGERYYVPDVYRPNYRLTDDFFGYRKGTAVDPNAGLSGLVSGAGTGAALGSAIMPGIGTAVGAGLGGLIGGFAGYFGGGQELEATQREQEIQAQLALENRRRILQGFRDREAAIETQRQIAEQMNPGEAIYGTDGRVGMLQMQQAQLAQQMAAQGARNRASLASRGLLGSGMEAATSGALAGQQATAQAQLQANALTQYQQQMQERQQRIAQTTMQQAELSAERERVLADINTAMAQGDMAKARQLAARNQALLQAGLQGLSVGLGAYQQSQDRELAKTQRKEDQEFLAKLFGGGGAAAAPAAAAATSAAAPAAAAVTNAARGLMAAPGPSTVTYDPYATPVERPQPLLAAPAGGLDQPMIMRSSGKLGSMEFVPAIYPGALSQLGPYSEYSPGTTSGASIPYMQGSQGMRNPVPGPLNVPKTPKSNKKASSGLSDLVYG